MDNENRCKLLVGIHNGVMDRWTTYWVGVLVKMSRVFSHGPTDCDGLRWEDDVIEQKYCEHCDYAPKTAMDNCKLCGRKQEVIKR